MSPSGITHTGNRRGSTEHQSSIARRCPRATSAASAGSPARSMRNTCELVNVSNTSWLAKPRRSNARGRSSSMNDPVAAKFFRSMICAASSARYSGSACARRMRSTSNACVLGAFAAPRTGKRARRSSARWPSSHAGGSMMCESASCMGRVAYAMSQKIRRNPASRAGSAKPGCARVWLVVEYHEVSGSHTSEPAAVPHLSRSSAELPRIRPPRPTS